MGSRILSLKKPWVGSDFHSTYSSYSRGVSVLVHKALSFVLLDLHLDPDGQYVIIHALCDRLDMIIVGLYVPPPTKMVVLHKIQTIVASYPTSNILIAGDFNMTPNCSADKLHPGLTTDTALSRWAEVYGLYDTWRWKNPHSRQFSCHSTTHVTLSRIDLIYVTGPLLTRVTAVSLLPRGISDHTGPLYGLSSWCGPVGTSQILDH